MSKSKMNYTLIIALLFAFAMQSFGQTVVPATKQQVDKLIAVLKSDAPHKEKADACRLLALVGTKDAVAPLAALLGDEKLSHMARYGLEPIPDPAVDEALRDSLGKLKGRPLVGVIGSIGVRRDTKAIRPLAKMLLSPDDQVAQAIGLQPERCSVPCQTSLPPISSHFAKVCSVAPRHLLLKDGRTRPSRFMTNCASWTPHTKSVAGPCAAQS